MPPAPSLPWLITPTNFTDKLTATIVDGGGDGSYPIAGYTYLVLHTTSMTDCVKAQKLLEYIKWSLTDASAAKRAADLGYSVLPGAVQQNVLAKLGPGYLQRQSRSQVIAFRMMVQMVIVRPKGARRVRPLRSRITGIMKEIYAGNESCRIQKCQRKPKKKPCSKELDIILRHGDRPWQAIIIAMAFVVLLIILAIGGLLWVDSSNARQQFGFSFIFPTADPSWNPILDKFQAWPFIYGTLLTSLIAIVFAVPISLGIAVFLAELCPAWLRTPLNWMIELLAAIPSVVYGLWGIFVFLPSVVEPFGAFLASTLGTIPGIGSFFAGPCPPAEPAGWLPV